ncbi:MAG TPA: glycosyltransferase family 4 protein [Acetobacteraceae bacterium]|nr:glycosyltransferase family 4 protein [Acetobacteraceae bacterium]
MMHVSLLVPAPFDQVSGGYAYDRRMVAELRAQGGTVSVVQLAGRFPLADDNARDAACAAWDHLTEPTRPVIDGLALPAFAGMEDALAARGAIGLIHHPTALETGFAEAERASLRSVERRLYGRLHRLIVTSEATAERLAGEFGVERARIAVVAPGTDDAPRCTGSGGPGCEILSIGTLVPRKGHDVLLRALARLFDLDWHLTIAGSPRPDPAHAQALVALTEELGIARHVRFAGEATDDALETLWRGADLFALATWFEGYGMAAAEALKRGLPVAVCSGGAAATLVEAEAGVVCEPGDQVQLSKALRRLIFSPSLRAEMGEVAWRIGQNLPRWETQAEAFATAIGA